MNWSDVDVGVDDGFAAGPGKEGEVELVFWTARVPAVRWMAVGAEMVMLETTATEAAENGDVGWWSCRQGRGRGSWW